MSQHIKIIKTSWTHSRKERSKSYLERKGLTFTLLGNLPGPGGVVPASWATGPPSTTGRYIKHFDHEFPADMPIPPGTGEKWNKDGSNAKKGKVKKEQKIGN